MTTEQFLKTYIQMINIVFPISQCSIGFNMNEFREEKYWFYLTGNGFRFVKCAAKMEDILFLKESDFDIFAESEMKIIIKYFQEWLIEFNAVVNDLVDVQKTIKELECK